MHSTAHAHEYSLRRPAPLLVLRERVVEDADSDRRRTEEPVAASDPSTASDWTSVHQRLVSLGKARAGHEREVCRWLLAAERLGVHARVGYASVGELAERLLGLNGRRTQERLRVGRALQGLRRLDAALASGELAWSAVRELTRVATCKTEEKWLAWAKGRRARQIEAAVASRAPGDGPADRPDPSRIDHRLSFAVRAETMALFRDLQSAVRKDLGGKPDDNALLYEIARRALGGSSNGGRSNYQVAVTRCEDCQRSFIEAGGTSLPVDGAVAEMFECDAQVLDLRGGATALATGADHRDGVSDVDGVSDGVSDGDGLAHTCTAAPKPHVGATPSLTDGPHAPTKRIRQRIRATTRRQVLVRDHERCVLPGCSNHDFLDVHHLDPRSEGGSHHPERLAVLCGVHHIAVHAGTIRVDGTSSTGFVFRHGDGAPYGGEVDAGRLHLTTQVFASLTKMGFKASEARARIELAVRAGTPNDFASLIREALRRA